MLYGYPDLSMVLATGMRARREAAGIQQDQIAAAARRCGLTTWRRYTVTAIEHGRRGLSLFEMLMLPHILETAGLGVVTFAQLLPDDDDSPIQIATGVVATTREVRRWMPQTMPPRDLSSVAKLVANIDLDVYRAAERHAARRLRVKAETVVTAAQARWGRSLTDERDARVSEGEARLSAALRDDVARRRQALRGHVTRALLEELRPLVKPTKKRRRRP
jgi:hypothetical protein